MKIAIQTQSLAKYYGYEDTYGMMREAGFEGVDWNVDSSWDFDALVKAEKLEGLCIFERPIEEVRAHYAHELSVLKKNGLEIVQAHAPMGCYSYERPEIVEYAIKIYKNMIPFLDELGVKYMVVHGVTKDEMMEDLTYDEANRLSYHVYESLIPELQKAKTLKVCMENLPTDTHIIEEGFWEGCCSDPHIAAKWIDGLNEKAGRECFGLCLDTGHLNVLRRPFYSYIPAMGNRILALHLHDNMQNSDSHLMPYVGTVRWGDFLEEMRKIGYEGDISFETCAQTSKNRLPRRVTPTLLSTLHDIGEYFRRQIQG